MGEGSSANMVGGIGGEGKRKRTLSKSSFLLIDKGLMADKSKIEWCDASWNPVRGCSRVSKGCEHCYAERVAHRLRDAGYDGLTRMTEHGPVWTGEVRPVPKLLDYPLRWKRPRRIFVNSVSDLFHEKVPIEFISQVFNIMGSRTLECGKRHLHEEECWTGEPHTFQILTKRPEQMRQIILELPDYVGEHWPGHSTISIAMEAGNWPLPNVWLGVSVENQPTFDERWPYLRDTPAAIRFISYEPALGPVDFSSSLPPSKREICICDREKNNYTADNPYCKWPHGKKTLNWIICGGESGPRARSMQPDWARSIRDQCRAAGIAFFFKQVGGRTPKAGGRLLDGRAWSEYPEVERIHA